MICDLDTLRSAVDGAPEGAWSLPSTFALTKVHEGYRRIELIADGEVREPELVSQLWSVLSEFVPIDKAWLSWIDPGGFIVTHSDAGPWHERWQVPIRTAGTLNGVRATDGVPFRVEHWLPHSVRNDTDQPRIHLVIDRDIAAGPALIAGFKTYPEG